MSSSKSRWLIINFVTSISKRVYYPPLVFSILHMQNSRYILHYYCIWVEILDDIDVISYK
ncbi:hypothetical protein A6E15_11185 [Natrinema saccharevitans]|uniref:Uncharacterized protein n=1 Tax=Natrinema saccharevitans TaxID=301967 RepID=A0A1S8AY83_9EURY|nr:hypothetical protein A6E15_11185 [Natrinema saccharevitans]